MKRSLVILGAAAVAFSVALVGCQSNKAGPGNSIQTERAGLAPNGDGRHTTIDFSIVLHNQESIEGWKVEMVTGNTTQKEWSGGATNLPETLTWDGLSGSGAIAAEGTYTALLTTYDGKGRLSTTQSQTFILDVSAPTGGLTFLPAQFTPSNDGVVQPVSIFIQGNSAVARMDSWSLDIIDEEGRAFQSFDGKWADTMVQWDGKSSAGGWVLPSHAYYAQLTLRDEFGVTSSFSSAISVSNLPNAERPVQQKTVAVIPGTGGFSPNGDDVMDSIRLALSFGERASVKSWKVEVLDSRTQAQKTFSGDGTSLPAMVRWDGRNDAGDMAPEAVYTARLTVDYGSSYKPAGAVSSSFVLDTTSPTGSVTLSDPLFSPMEASPVIVLNVSASDLARIDSWKMEIYDPENHLFQAFSSKWPARSAIWNGKGFKGNLVESAEDYPVVVKIRDEFGNVGRVTSTIPVDILVEKIPTGYRILSSRIFFKAYTADYTDVRSDLAGQNQRRLGDMAAKLKKFPDYNIRLVGHAVMIHWDNKPLGDIEQRDVLLPLSAARAEAVKTAMIDRGLQASMFTVQGVGAADPIVPDSDFSDHWRNRRVAFFIEK